MGRATPLGTRGIRLGYHNHSFEFAPLDGTTVWDVLLAELPAGVELELDVYWASVGGRDPVAEIRDGAERVRLIHMKDRLRTRSHTTRRRGRGPDIPGDRPAGRAAGVEWYIAEQDDPREALEDIQKALRVPRIIRRLRAGPWPARSEPALEHPEADDDEGLDDAEQGRRREGRERVDRVVEGLADLDAHVGRAASAATTTGAAGALTDPVPVFEHGPIIAHACKLTDRAWPQTVLADSSYPQAMLNARTWGRSRTAGRSIRLGLASCRRAALLVVPCIGDRVRPRPTRVDLGRGADFVAQTNNVQCVGASTQMMLNMMAGRCRIVRRPTQRRLQTIARAWSGSRPDGRTRRGAGVTGWAAGLTLAGAGPYRVVGLPTHRGGTARRGPGHGIDRTTGRVARCGAVATPG